MYGGRGDLLHLREAARELLTIVIDRNFIAGVLAKRFLMALESILASPGHLRPELQPLRGGSSAKIAQGRASVARSVSLTRKLHCCSSELSSSTPYSRSCTHITMIFP